MLLSELTALYARHRIGLSAAWVGQLQTSTRLLARWLGRPATTQDLTADTLLGFLGDLFKVRAAATTNAKRQHLLTLWAFAHAQGLASEPALIHKVKEPRRLPDAWTVAEIERLISVCRSLRGKVGEISRSTWWPGVVLTCYDTGQRISTVLQAQSADCNCAERFIVFRAASQKQLSDTYHSLSDQTIAAISPLRNGRALLFPWPYNRRYLWFFFRHRIVEAAGLHASKRGMGLFHKLRRTSGSLVEAAGGDGSRHLGNSRAVFERSYRDPRICGGSQLDKLPRPRLSGGNGNGEEVICG
jgi:integrase